jgi:hypothetical protein
VSKATVRHIPLPALGRGCQRIEIDCVHATTGITQLNAADDGVVNADDLVRAALAVHFDLEGCRCTRRLWKRYWRTEPGQLPVLPAPPEAN